MVFNDIIKQQQTQLLTKDTIIINLNQKITNFESIISTKTNQTSLAQQLNADLEKALRQSKRRTFLYKVGTGIGAVVTLVLLTK